MKKLLSVVMTALIFAVSSFALDLSADVNFAVPMTAAGFTDSNVGDKYFETSLGFDAGVQAMVDKKFGLKLSFGADFPQSKSGEGSVKIINSWAITSYNDDFSGYNNGFSVMSLFVAPVINVKQTTKYTVSVNPGMLFRFYNASVKTGDTVTKYSWTNMGAGAEIDARYKITNNIYARFGCPLVWLFNMQNTSGDSTKYNGFYFAPHFGIAYKF